MQRHFIVSGYRPAYSKRANEVLNALDLGISGAFIKFIELATVTLNSNITQDQLEMHIPAIKDAYEKGGCVKVNVIEIDETSANALGGGA